MSTVMRRIYLAPIILAAAGTAWLASLREGQQAPAKIAIAKPQPIFDFQNRKVTSTSTTEHGLPPEPSRFPDTLVGRMVANHLSLATTLGPGADENYLHSLQKLHEQSKEVLLICVGAYEKAPESDYNLRELLVETISELRVPEAFPVLKTIAFSSIPAEKGDVHGVSTVILETSMRMAAAEGLGRLSKLGVDGAASALLQLAASTESLTVRREAIRAYLGSGDYDQRATELRNVLPATDHSLITLKTDSFQEISKGMAINDVSAQMVESDLFRLYGDKSKNNN